MNTKLVFAFLVLVMMFLFTGCADTVAVDDCVIGDPYGFWGGLWHGLITPFSFIVSLFSDNVSVYAVNNNGGWYDFGFLIGASITLGGTGKASNRRRHR
ncbi:MAG TPA: hypothetical protein PLU49_00070 [Saprospiraceae bacterium]|nr:hypothetical protein [Saprospiraceae bacterium]